MRYTIAVDFDGVIHDYDGNFKASHIIEGKPVEGAIEWLLKIIQKFDVVIHTCRAHGWRGRRAIRQWLKLHSGACVLEDVTITDRKPHALVYLDDRAIRYTGHCFPTATEIHQARPWNRGKDAISVDASKTV